MYSVYTYIQFGVCNVTHTELASLLSPIQTSVTFLFFNRFWWGLRCLLHTMQGDKNPVACNMFRWYILQRMNFGDDDNSFAVLFIIERWMRLDILSSKPYPSVIPGSVACLIEDRAFGGLCGKTLGILSLYSATKRVFSHTRSRFPLFLLDLTYPYHYHCEDGIENPSLVITSSLCQSVILGMDSSIPPSRWIIKISYVQTAHKLNDLNEHWFVFQDTSRHDYKTVDWDVKHQHPKLS